MEGSLRRVVERIPVCKTKAGPRDGDAWLTRLAEEYTALIKYVENNKAEDNNWFHLESDENGIKWSGRCWGVHEMQTYEFDLEFEIPVTYPATAPEIAIPALDGKTPKMYRGGRICQSVHFQPLWTRNVPKFGIAHAMALGLGPWIAAELPVLVSNGTVQPKPTPAAQ